MKRFWLVLVLIINIIVIVRISLLNVNNNYEIKDTIVYGLTAPRGRILDINGNILVDNIGVKSLIFNKLNIGNNNLLLICKKLSEVLDLNVRIDDYNLKYYYYQVNKSEVDSLVDSNIIKKYKERKITSKDLFNIKLDLISDDMLKMINVKEAYIYYLLNNGYSYQDKIIKIGLTDDEYLKINELNLPGIRTELTWERYYPYKNLLRDIFGNVSSYEQGLPKELKDYYLDKGYYLNDRVGINNLEYLYDDFLRGEKAEYLIKDNRLVLVKEAQKGKDLVLSIDIDLQQNIEKIMENEMIKAKKEFNTKYYDSSYLIVSNPNTGEIMALIGKKINNDNSFLDYSYYSALSSFTVGSVVKGATISVGYKYNIINENTRVVDGCVRLYSQKPKCSWKRLGSLNDLEALRMSSNYFQYLIAIGVSGHSYYSGVKLNASIEHFNIYREMLASYGLGALTGIDLSNESSGQKGTSISDDLLLNIAIGQYDTYTPLELSQYINTIASGERMQLSLLKYVLNNDGSIFYTKENKVYNKVLIDDYYLNRIREGFKKVNQSGTGYSYTNHNFVSAGKTGTAESFLSSKDSNSLISTVSTSYIMYAPYDNPLFSIVIVSPHIKYKNRISDYKYPINARIMRQVSDLVYNKLVN